MRPFALFFSVFCVIAISAAPRFASAQSSSRVAIGRITATGPLGVPAIRRVVRERVATVQRCFATRLAERPGLSGRLTLRLFVASTWHVVAAEVSRTDIGDAAVSRCASRAFDGVQFPARETADTHASIELRFGRHRLPSGDAEEVTAGPGDPAFDGPRSTGSVEPIEVRELHASVYAEVRAVEPEHGRDALESASRRVSFLVRNCYERFLLDHEGAQVTMRVNVSLDARGHTTDATVEATTHRDEALLTCTRAALARMRPAPWSASGPTTLQLQLVMRPPGAADEALRERGVTPPAASP